MLRIYSDYGEVGDRERAKVYEDRAYEMVKDSADLSNYAIARTYEANRAIESGRPQEAREILRKAIDHIFPSGNFQNAGYVVPMNDMLELYRLSARLASEADEDEEAVRLCDQAIAWGFEESRHRPAAARPCPEGEVSREGRAAEGSRGDAGRVPKANKPAV